MAGKWNARSRGMGASAPEQRRLAATGGRQVETTEERRERLSPLYLQMLFGEITAEEYATTRKRELRHEALEGKQ